MTPNQYRTAIKTFGLSQAGAAHFLGVALRTSHGYAKGDYPVPPATAKLLTLMLRLEWKPKDVAKFARVETWEDSKQDWLSHPKAKGRRK